MKTHEKTIEVECRFVADGFAFDVPVDVTADQDKLREYLLDQFDEYCACSHVIYEVHVDGKCIGDNRLMLTVKQER